MSFRKVFKIDEVVLLFSLIEWSYRQRHQDPCQKSPGLSSPNSNLRFFGQPGNNLLADVPIDRNNPSNTANKRR